MSERNISEKWVSDALVSPQKVEADPRDESLEHRFRTIEEAGNRVIHVVINKVSRPAKVVTMFLDRKMKGRI